MQRLCGLSQHMRNTSWQAQTGSQRQFHCYVPMLGILFGMPKVITLALYRCGYIFYGRNTCNPQIKFQGLTSTKNHNKIKGVIAWQIKYWLRWTVVMEASGH